MIAFAWVDVFATTPLTGNPLPVGPDADGLDEALMVAIAKEFNQSETTFIFRPTLPGACVRLRSFTPTGAEVTGAGHNRLGAWWWLAQRGQITASDNGLAQQLGTEVLPVRLIGDQHLERVAMTRSRRCG